MMTRSAVRGACGFGVGGVGGLFLTASWFQWSGPWSGPSFAVDVAALLLGYFLSGAIGGSSLGMGRRVSVGFGLGFAVLGLAVPFMTLALIGIQAEGTGAFWHVVVIAMTFAGAFAVAGGIGAAFIRQESSLAWTGAIGFGVGGAVGGGIIAAGLGLQLSRVIPHTDYWMLTGIFGLGWLIAYGIGGAQLRHYS